VANSAGRLSIWVTALLLLAGSIPWPGQRGAFAWAHGGRGAPQESLGALVYNSVADLLAGDLWETTTPAVAAEALRAVPGHWPLVGLGTTARPWNNGEIVVLGTAGHPEFLWCEATYPNPVVPVIEARFPFLAVAACDPARQVVLRLRAGEDLHAQVTQWLKSQGIPLAAVSVTGTFRDIRYTIAHHLAKEGSPLTQPGIDVTRYLLPFQASPPAAWRFAGFYAAAPEAQALISVPGSPLHLHGLRVDRAHGGHLSGATVVAGEARACPLPPPALRQCDLTVQDVRLFGDRVGFRVANTGANRVAVVPVQGLVQGQVLFRRQLPALEAGQSREIFLELTWPSAERRVTIEVDPANEIREANETNNTVPGEG
jgi:hypothetical protein